MPIAERLGASGGVWVAPVGTKPGDHAAWKSVGWVDESDFIVDSSKWEAAIDASLIGSDAAAKGWKPATFANEVPGWLRNDLWPDESPRCLRPYLDTIDHAVAKMAAAEYCGYSSQRWLVGVEPPAINDHINKRSKPMALTKNHEYTDSDGDQYEVRPPHSFGDPVDVTAIIDTSGSGEGRYVHAADSIPLALNVLGYDRPDAAQRSHSVAIGSSSAGTSSVTTDRDRDWHLAVAACYLQAVDSYDQRAAKRKADEAAAVKAAEIAKAKERVAVANREIAERFLRKAKDAYEDAIVEAYRQDVSPEVTAKLQAALSSYETARRKVEGLPN